MKKSLIALAAMVAAGAASAQSSVTLFGIVDAAVQRVENEGGGKVTRMVSGAYNTSRFGLRGTEDLGGGVAASFWLEAGFESDSGLGNATNTNNQTGPLAGATGGGGFTFNRRSTASLSGGFGELRLGRDYTPQFWNLNSFEPFGTNGVGASLVYQSVSAGNPTAARASNSIGYFLPANLGGVYGQAMYYFGENDEDTVNEDNGSGFGVRLGFTAGPVNLAVSASHTEASATVAGGEGNINQYNIGGQVNLGFARLMGSYEQDEVRGADNKGWLIGGLIPVGAGEIRLSYAEYEFDGAGESQKFALGYVHNLSKRTAVYATYAHVENDSGGRAAVTAGPALPAANGSSDGFDIGIRHSF